MKKKKKMDKVSKVLFFLSSISFILVAIVVVQFFIFENITKKAVLDGTVVNGINLSGMEKNRAIEKLSAYFTDKSEKLTVDLKYKDKSWQLSKNDFKVNTNIHTILDAATTHKLNTADYKKQTETLSVMLENGESLQVALNYIFIGLEDLIESICAEIEISPTNSEIKFNAKSENLFEITPEKNGLAVDKVALYNSLNSQFLKRDNIKINIPTTEVLADVTAVYNKSLTNKIASYSTDVSDSTGGRKANVVLALEKFNGMRVESGEEVSFNKLTAPHSAKNGYKVATIIYKGQFVDGVGGGICQSSTTLYNALLLAGVEILEVNKHTLPVKYVPLALDAMVAEHISDLRFKNIYDHPIFIKTHSDKNSVYVEIFSHTLPDNVTYSTRSETVKTIAHKGDQIIPDTKGEYTDKVLFKGEYHRLTYPRGGCEAKSYLQTLKDGKVINEKLLRHETYRPQYGTIIEGVETPPDTFKIIEDEVGIIFPEEQASGIIEKNIHLLIPTNYCP